ncbi:hypothetical protein KAR91_13605, partial [Candidatus Pacearchaeota archaeon]|nr:hypothetical protein [Candidatus Pacearchaeota archaeon]
MLEEWNKDPEFKALPTEEKGRILSNYFNDTMIDSEFLALPEDEQGRIKNNFLTSEGFAPEPVKPVGLGQQIAGAFKEFGASLIEDELFLEGEEVESVGEGFLGEHESSPEMAEFSGTGAKPELTLKRIGIQMF